MRRTSIIIAGTLALLLGSPQFLCGDCHFATADDLAPIMSSGDCCTEHCSMMEPGSCSLGATVDDQNRLDQIVVLRASGQERPHDHATAIVRGAAPDGDAVRGSHVSFVTPVTHDPPGPPLPLLHSQFLL